MYSGHLQHLVCQEPEGYTNCDTEAFLCALHHESIMLRVREELAPFEYKPSVEGGSKSMANLQAHSLVRWSITLPRLPHPSYPTVSKVFGIMGSLGLEQTLQGYGVQLEGTGAPTAPSVLRAPLVNQ